MSMFHELMMRKKEETLYPVIKGSLTDTDGVISGFVNTGENYLQVNNMDSLALADSWEIVLKLENVSGSYVIGSNLERIITISLSTGKLYLSSNGSSWNIAGGVGSGSIPANSYVRVKFTGTQYTFDYSSDKVTWTNRATVTSSTKITSSLTYLRIGAWWTGSSYTTNFSGTINLDKSSIKINSTKYKIQAVVGYTIVGSLTESPSGVFSGFSSANYLKINVPTAINYNVFELNIKFKTSDNSVYQRLFWNSNNLLFVISSGVLSLNFYNTSNNWTSRSAGAMQNNTWYWYKIKFDIVNKTMIVDCSTDGINFTNVLSSQNITNINPNIKITTNGIIFCDQDNSGNITLDLNSTNIKKDNKLWFNGQEG